MSSDRQKLKWAWIVFTLDAVVGIIAFRVWRDMPEDHPAYDLVVAVAVLSIIVLFILAPVIWSWHKKLG